MRMYDATGATLWERRRDLSGVKNQMQAGYEALLMGLQAASELGLPNLCAQGSHDILNIVSLAHVLVT